jgi:pyrimidine-specific ribonucleoside hydrolase
MFKKIFIICCLAAAVLTNGYSHPGKAKYHVIVDTDCAFDDMRAILLLLADHDVEVVAITTTEGALLPQEGYKKVKSLLSLLHHEGIPVAAGRRNNAPVPACRDFVRNISWGPATTDSSRINAIDLMITAYQDEEQQKISLICLGSLTNIADLFDQKPELKDKTDQIIWYNEKINPLEGVNYSADKGSADKLVKSGIPINVVSAVKSTINFDGDIIKPLYSVKTPYGITLLKTYEQKGFSEEIKAGHFKVFDDLVPVYLLTPDLFTTVKIDNLSIKYLKDETFKPEVRKLIIEILAMKKNNECTVLKDFPVDAGRYSEDIKPFVDKIIEKYGLAEWRAGVLANEIHGNLGMYDILGVKMGIRVREYFNIGFESIKVYSFAGKVPPVSCINDGLQVSTGATLGHGLISTDDKIILPEADFIYRNKKIHLSLKKEVSDQISKDLEEGVSKFGSGTDQYWDYVKELAVKYWEDKDRHDIFEIKELK